MSNNSNPISIFSSVRAKSNLLLISALLMGATCGSCGGSTSPSGGGGSNNNGLAANTLVFTAGGTTYNGTDIGANVSHWIQLNGHAIPGSPAIYLTIMVQNITSAGTYNVTTFSTDDPTSKGISMNYSTAASGTTLNYANMDAASVGTMTITAISASSIQATFNATLSLTPGQSGPSTVAITNGAVNAAIY